MPPAVTLNVVVLPAQVVWSVGCVLIFGKIFTVIDALAVGSLFGTLSTTPFTLAAPAVPFVVKVTVAVPVACIVVCAPESVPNMAE